MKNANEFDRRKGGRTMPADAEPVNTIPARLEHKRRVQSADHIDRPGWDDPIKVKIGGIRYGRSWCLLVWKQIQGGIPRSALADTYDVSKNVIHAIEQKGTWGKL